jgi:hypothetical protein
MDDKCDCGDSTHPKAIYISYATLLQEIQCYSEQKQVKADAIGDACCAKLAEIQERKR